MALRIDDVDLGRDRVLVERYQAGDDSAFDDLYCRYFRRLHRYCTRRVHDVHTAEEIAQEAFVRALQALPRLEGDRRFYPWMTVIASRLCVDHHRSQQRSEPSDEVDPGIVDADLDHVFTAVDHGHLATALERINPRHRRVLELREREGLSYEAIAERMDVTLGTVEALLHRARKALRREFLAVADEPGRLAALPVFGWVAHQLTKLRARFPNLTDAAQPLAYGVASMAMVMGPAIGVFNAPGGSGAGDAIETVASMSDGAVTDGSGGLADAISNAFDLRGSATSGAGPAAGDIADDGPGSQVVATVSEPKVAVGDPSGEQKVRDLPYEKHVGPVKAGAGSYKDGNERTTEACVYVHHAEASACQSDPVRVFPGG